MQIALDEQSIRTLLEVLNRAEYEFVTTNNLWVTDRPDIDPDIKFKISFTEIIKLISEQLSLLEKLVDNHNESCL